MHGMFCCLCGVMWCDVCYILHWIVCVVWRVLHILLKCLCGMVWCVATCSSYLLSISGRHDIRLTLRWFILHVCVSTALKGIMDPHIRITLINLFNVNFFILLLLFLALSESKISPRGIGWKFAISREKNACHWYVTYFHKYAHCIFNYL